jgi:hypothetical protein
MADPLAPIVQKMLGQVMGMINSPGNSYYFPDWIKKNGYDPYGANKVMKWDITLSDPSILEQASNICMDINVDGTPCPDDQAFYIGVPNSNPRLTLGGDTPGGLLVTGCANAFMQSMVCDPNNAYNIQAIMKLSTLPPSANWTQNVVINGKFTFTQFCCCSTNQSTCVGPPQPQVGTGTFAATFNGPTTLLISFNITKLSPGVLNIAVSKVVFQPPMKQVSGKSLPNILVTIAIQSIPKMKNQDAYNNMAMGAFNSEQGLNSLVSQINVVMNDPSQLSFMSTALTNVIDGYLRANHLYPFDGSYLAVY